MTCGDVSRSLIEPESSPGLLTDEAPISLNRLDIRLTGAAAIDSWGHETFAYLFRLGTGSGVQWGHPTASATELRIEIDPDDLTSQ